MALRSAGLQTARRATQALQIGGRKVAAPLKACAYIFWRGNITYLSSSCVFCRCNWLTINLQLLMV